MNVSDGERNGGEICWLFEWIFTGFLHFFIFLFISCLLQLHGGSEDNYQWRTWWTFTGTWSASEPTLIHTHTLTLTRVNFRA